MNDLLLNNDFGKSLGFQHINPHRIKFAEDEITSENPFRNPRSNLDAEEIKNKRESIKEIGLLKPPIVRPIEGDSDYDYQMVAGSLRLRCILKLIDDNESCYDPESETWKEAKELYKTINCNVRECDELTAIRISIAENLEHTQVPELDMMEYCQELVSLQDKDGKKLYSKKDLAKLCNRSESWVSLTLQLNELGPAHKKLMYAGRLSRTAAIHMMLGAKKEHYDTVIQKCQETIEEESKEEEKEASLYEHKALAELEEAEVDAIISEQNKDEESLNVAKKRIKNAQKIFSVASEKKSSAIKKRKEGVITAETVNKVISSMSSEVKKGKSKVITQKLMRRMKKDFKTSIDAKDNLNGEILAVNTAMAVLDICLGERPIVDDIFSIIEEQKNKVETARTEEVENKEEESIS